MVNHVFFITLTLDPKLFSFAEDDNDRRHQFNFFISHLNKIINKVQPILVYGCTEIHSPPNTNIHFHFIVYYSNKYKFDNKHLLKYFKDVFCQSVNNKVCIQPGNFRKPQSIDYINKLEPEKNYEKQFYIYYENSLIELVEHLPASPLDS